MTKLYENRNRFRKFLNRNEWQHTWHLPKSRYGDVNWFSDETKSKVMTILQDDAEGLKAELAECLCLIETITKGA